MDRLIAALSANLPGGYGASGAVQRQASFFGRFCEELIRVSETGEAEEEEEEEGYCRRKMREAWELLCKEDDELRDPTGSLLRGLADTLTYIAMVRPEVFGEEPETQEDELADLSDLVGGRISLLARSRHPLNVISYLTSMTTFAPLVEDQLSLLLGNSLVKMVGGSRVPVVVAGLKCVRQVEHVEETVRSLMEETALRLVRHGDQTVRYHAWRMLRQGSIPLDETQRQTLSGAFAKECNLDVVEAALEVVMERVLVGAKPLLTTKVMGDLDELMEHLVRANLAPFHPLLFRRLLKYDLLSEERLAMLVDQPATLRHAVMWRELQRRGHWRTLKPDTILAMVRGCLESEESNVIYAGLLLLNESLPILGSNVLELQLVLSKLYHSEDPMVVLRVLEIFFQVATAENWTRILETALKRPVDDVIVRMRILRQCARLAVQMMDEERPNGGGGESEGEGEGEDEGEDEDEDGVGAEEKESWLARIVGCVPEGATTEEIQGLVGMVGVERIQSMSCSARVRVIAGMEGEEGDVEYALRWRLVKGEMEPTLGTAQGSGSGYDEDEDDPFFAWSVLDSEQHHRPRHHPHPHPHPHHHHHHHLSCPDDTGSTHEAQIDVDIVNIFSSLSLDAMSNGEGYNKQ